MVRERKNPIKFKISLNEEQKHAKSVILNSTITIITGLSGSGKTFLAAQTALNLLFLREIEKIYLIRPAVTAGEDLGFLPGDKDEKLEPYIASIYENMCSMYAKEIIDKLFKENKIEVLPIAFARGRNFKNSFVLVDEGQNITHSQMELLLTRLCVGSKMVICGDVRQIDLKQSKYSGFAFAYQKLAEIPGVSAINLITNNRHPIVEDILKYYEHT